MALILVLCAFVGALSGLGGVFLGAWLTWRCLRPSEPLTPPKSQEIVRDAEENEDKRKDDDEDEEDDDDETLDDVL